MVVSKPSSTKKPVTNILNNSSSSSNNQTSSNVKNCWKWGPSDGNCQVALENNCSIGCFSVKSPQDSSLKIIEYDAESYAASSKKGKKGRITTESANSGVMNTITTQMLLRSINTPNSDFFMNPVCEPVVEVKPTKTQRVERTTTTTKKEKRASRRKTPYTKKSRKSSKKETKTPIAEAAPKSAVEQPVLTPMTITQQPEPIQEDAVQPSSAVAFTPETFVKDVYPEGENSQLTIVQQETEEIITESAPQLHLDVNMMFQPEQVWIVLQTPFWYLNPMAAENCDSVDPLDLSTFFVESDS